MKENQTEKNQLENERSDYRRASKWMLENYYERICQLSQTFLSIIDSYFPGERKNMADSFDPETAISILANPESDTKNVSEESSIIEPDTIYRTGMYEKFLVLEQKLVTDNYLNQNLYWIHTHKNDLPDIKNLVIFLTGLMSHNYFLPNKDPKIKTFFEAPTACYPKKVTIFLPIGNGLVTENCPFLAFF